MAECANLMMFSALGLLLLALASIIFTQHQRSWLLSYLRLGARGRRTSTSKTPPRSVSPEKESPAVPSSPINYKAVFPPPNRDGLAEVAKTVSGELKEKLQGTFDEIEFRKGVVPFEADYRNCGPSAYTPTGISIGEVKALGDFPDYAELAGVPPPRPYEGFKFESAIARPYRPLRWAYHQTMSLTKLETDWWLELEKNYISTIASRRELFEKHGHLVLNSLPGSELATKELMEMALQFYCARYPQFFSLTNTPDNGYVFSNALLKTATIIKDHHPLQVLLHNVPEDFAIMLRNPSDGFYYFRAGMICSALGWNVNTKLGMQLKQIHSPIPDYKEKMEFSMDRYFAKLPSNRPIQRGSWGLEVDTPLFMPPGDPHEQYRLSQDPSLSLSRVHLRVDWQTLRRLPLSGAIVFNFKGLFTPVTEFQDEPYIPALVRRVLEQGKKNMMEYKNTWHVEHVVIPALKEWEKEQVEKGLVEEGWEVHTLEETPFFPGWDAKWHRQQGF